MYRFFHGVRQYAARLFESRTKRRVPTTTFKDKLLDHTRIGTLSMEKKWGGCLFLFWWCEYFE